MLPLGWSGTFHVPRRLAAFLLQATEVPPEETAFVGRPKA